MKKMSVFSSNNSSYLVVKNAMKIKILKLRNNGTDDSMTIEWIVIHIIYIYNILSLNST